MAYARQRQTDGFAVALGEQNTAERSLHCVPKRKPLDV